MTLRVRARPSPRRCAPVELRSHEKVVTLPGHYRRSGRVPFARSPWTTAYPSGEAERPVGSFDNVAPPASRVPLTSHGIETGHARPRPSGKTPRADIYFV